MVLPLDVKKKKKKTDYFPRGLYRNIKEQIKIILQNVE